MKPTSIDLLALPSLPLTDRSKLPRCPAIYFVLDGETVLYIGRTGNLQHRWMAHHRWQQLKGVGKNIRVAWLEFSEPEFLAEIETALIKSFEPTLNRSVVPEDGATIHVVIPDDLKKEFKAACVLEGNNMSEVVVQLIEDWLQRRQNAKGQN